MHPTLIKIGGLAIPSYGFMLALSFLAGIYLAARRARKYGVDVQQILDLSVYIIIATVVGSRLTYIVFHLDDYENILDVFALWQGGATLYGGLLLAVLASYVFSVKRGTEFLLLADINCPSIALGMALTRVGCFLSGCCFGEPTSLPWGVVFPPASAAGIYARSFAAGSVALHPAQLYSSLGSLIIFTVLMLTNGRLTKRGGTFGLFLVMYALVRFTIDFFRFYESNMLIAGITLNQALSLLLALAGLWLLMRKIRERGPGEMNKEGL